MLKSALKKIAGGKEKIVLKVRKKTLSKSQQWTEKKHQRGNLGNCKPRYTKIRDATQKEKRIHLRNRAGGELIHWKMI